MQHDTLQSVYNFLIRYMDKHGYAPSIREIAAACYIGTSTASKQLSILEAQGRIMRDDAKARSIRLLDLSKTP
jgi:repressor LexA